MHECGFTSRIKQNRHFETGPEHHVWTARYRQLIAMYESLRSTEVHFRSLSYALVRGLYANSPKR